MGFEAEAAKLSEALDRFEGQQLQQRKMTQAAKGSGLYGLNERDEWLHDYNDGVSNN